MRATGVEHVPRGRLRARGEPRLQLRPLAARDPALPGPPAALHGEVGALLCRRSSWILRGGGAFKVRRGEGDDGGDRHAPSSSPGRARSSSCSRRARGARRGCARSITRAAAHGRGADRAARRRAARPGGDRRHRPPRAGSGPLRVAYGPPVELDDLQRAGRPRGLADRDRPADGGDRAAREDAVTQPLLVVDGDSLAHRAYHALPKSIRRAGTPGTLVGFTNMLVRLWEPEQPRAVLVGWDTLDDADLPARGVRGATSPGASSTTTLLEQLDLLPELVAALGFAAAKARRATRPTTSSPRRSRRGGAARRTAVVVDLATATLPARERAHDVLIPTRGVSELARIGPAEVRERYGVEPDAGPGLHRAARRPVRQAARAPRASARRRRRTLLAQYGSLEAALEAGRFAAEADDLRLYRRIATLDASAPLPPLDDQTPTWAAASALAREWGLNQLADRLARAGARRAIELVSHRRFARLHPTGDHPERPERIDVAARRVPGRRGPAPATRGGPRALPHRRARRRGSATIDDADVARRRHGLHRDELGGGARSPRALRSRRSSAAASRSCARPATTRSRERAMGFCLFNNVASRPAARRRSSASSASRSSTGTSTTATARRTIFWDDPTRPLRLAPPVAVLPGHRRARASRARRRSTCRCRPARGDAEYLARVRRARSSRRSQRFEPDLLLVSAGFDAHVDDPLADMRVTDGRLPRARAPLRRRSRRASPPCSRAATTSRRCRRLSSRRSRGFRANSQDAYESGANQPARWAGCPGGRRRPSSEPGPGQLLVDVAAAGVNYRDVYEREGRYGGGLPAIIGVEGRAPSPAAATAWRGSRRPAAMRSRSSSTPRKPSPSPKESATRWRPRRCSRAITAQFLTTSTHAVQPGDNVLVHAAAGASGCS